MLKFTTKRYTTKNISGLKCKLKLVRYQTTTTSGILGTNRFVQVPRALTSNPSTSNKTTAVCIADPYLIYKDLIHSKQIDSDPHQLALIKKLRVLSERLQSYKPDLTSIKINRLVRELEMRYNKHQHDEKGVLFGYTVGWFRERENKKLRTELVRVLNDYDDLTSDDMKNIPKGLLINGEVGCGKTMLMDIFADSLPVQGKWRIHWSVFIQWVMKEIEMISTRKRDSFMQANHPLLNYENEFVLFEVAARLIEKSHVLILDEFMLPDIAAAKIVNVLFVYYFKLGGVLVASSNRLPEELYSGSVNKSTMGQFEKILRARCDVWNMQSDNDYRTNLKEADIADDKWMVLQTDPECDKKWSALVSNFIDLNNCQTDATPFTSYGRDIMIPKTDGNTVAYFDFQDVVRDSAYGPGDFISIATKYPNIIIDNVPILSVKKKNNARRLITFIDAIYDSRCNLVIKLETDPANLFFPDIKDNSPSRFKCTPLEDSPNPVCLSEAGQKQVNIPEEATHTTDIQDIEMFAKTEMDMSNPYRPNFATYEDDNKDYNILKGEENMEKNFTDMKKFTGEDEMFAYKRAVSRINEMTQSLRWRNNKWVPLHDSIKPWESTKSEDESNSEMGALKSNSSAFMDGKIDDEKSGTFTQRKDAPQFKDYNFWSMGKWKNKKEKLHDDIAKKWVEGAGDVKP